VSQFETQDLGVRPEMKRASLSVLILAALLTPSTAQQQLKCDIGPLTKFYGGTNWLVYSCDDRQTVVFLTAPDNPAMPFYFMLSKHEAGYQLNGEGTGNKDATNAAFADLKKLSESEIEAIIAQTKAR
jgi:hypothetical protein